MPELCFIYTQVSVSHVTQTTSLSISSILRDQVQTRQAEHWGENPPYIKTLPLLLHSLPGPSYGCQKKKLGVGCGQRGGCGSGRGLFGRGAWGEWWTLSDSLCYHYSQFLSIFYIRMFVQRMFITLVYIRFCYLCKKCSILQSISFDLALAWIGFNCGNHTLDLTCRC
ncbi:hypothetical protein XELAEV_18042136mg [Xenopus laevis]|uniref:Uncharacterized protein n=1 Tax=Xenopus laevis TaxID=8355 RepID=A0A974C484_XENLA|nr:hypothetical protein XELAEV_18042136mg [Xenopus laevis]